jgi:thioredoxin-related protein
MNSSSPVFFDGDMQLMDILNVRVMPTLVILDRKGKVLFFHEGFQPGDETIIQLKIQELLIKGE